MIKFCLQLLNYSELKKLFTRYLPQWLLPMMESLSIELLQERSKHRYTKVYKYCFKSVQMKALVLTWTLEEIFKNYSFSPSHAQKKESGFNL